MLLRGLGESQRWKSMEARCLPSRRKDSLQQREALVNVAETESRLWKGPRGVYNVEGVDAELGLADVTESSSNLKGV